MLSTFCAAVTAAAVTLVGTVAAAPEVVSSASAPTAVTHLTIVGDGSAWAANAVNQWVSDEATASIKVVYTSSTSAQGRQNFAGANNDYAVSDIPYQGIDPVTKALDSSSRPYAYVPLAAGGLSFPYHLEVAGGRITDLRLSGETLAKIFTNQIINWDDPAITADNNGRQLPSIPIIPVVHSEASGTTLHLTQYLAAQYPAIWAAFNGGSPQPAQYFPTAGSEVSQSGSDGVMNYLTSPAGQGTIGYDEYSYALGAKYSVAKIENSAGYYVLPTPLNVAVALTAATVDSDPSSPTYLQEQLNGVYANPDPRSYPLSSYSYGIIPTSPTDPKMNTGKRQSLADFLTYSVCAGQAGTESIGYSPLPKNLFSAAFDQIQRLHTADPGVDVSGASLSECRNPTFDPGDPSSNYLDRVAPLPAACDRAGAGPCSITPVPTPSPVPTPTPTATSTPSPSPTPTPTPLPSIGQHPYALSGSATLLGTRLTFGGNETLTTTAGGAISGLGVVRASTLSFLLDGSIPVTARIGIVPGSLTGGVNQGAWTLTAPVRLAILSLTVPGAGALLSADQSCQTSTRSPLLLKQTAIASNTHTFAGTLAVSRFSDCGAATSTINSLVAGQTLYMTISLTELS